MTKSCRLKRGTITLTLTRSAPRGRDAREHPPTTRGSGGPGRGAYAKPSAYATTRPPSLVEAVKALGKRLVESEKTFLAREMPLIDPGSLRVNWLTVPDDRERVHPELEMAPNCRCTLPSRVPPQPRYHPTELRPSEELVLREIAEACPDELREILTVEGYQIIAWSRPTLHERVRTLAYADAAEARVRKLVRGYAMHDGGWFARIIDRMRRYAVRLA